MLGEVARELGVSEHDPSDPIDPHILRGVCFTLPTLQTQNDMQVHIRTRNGVCALATWFSRLLGFVVEVTRRQDDNKDCQPSIVRFGTTERRVCVKIDTVSEERPCVMLNRLHQLTEIKDPALLAELGGTYKGNPDMLRIGRLQNEYRVDEEGKIFQYETMQTFLRTDSNSSFDKKRHCVTRGPVKGAGKKVLEWAATTFAGATGSQGRKEWHENMEFVAILFALDVAVHLQKCGVRLLSDKSVKAGDLLKRVNDGSNDLALGGGNMLLVPHWHIIDAARLIFDNEHIMAGSYHQTHQSTIMASRINDSSLFVAKELGILLLTFANVIRFESCVELLLNFDFNLLDDHALVRRIRAWHGNSPIPVQENDWFEIVAKLLVGRSEGVNAETFDLTTLLSDHGWSIYRPVINLRRDPSDTGRSLIGRVQPATEYTAGLVMDTANVLLDILGKFCVCPGVPYHNGIQKRRIEDVAMTPLTWRSHYSPNFLSYRSGSRILPSFQGQFDVSEDCVVGKESFVIRTSISHEVKFQMFQACRRTGSRELYRALWPARKTAGCECRVKLLPPTVELPTGCGALVVRCDDDFDSCVENLILCLTGGDSIARWRALIAYHGDANVLLRGKDCCLTCAVEQASKLPGKCHLIL